MTLIPPTLYLLTPEGINELHCSSWGSARHAAALLIHKGVLITPDGHPIEPATITGG